MDTFALQRHIHTPSSFRHWDFRSICFRPYFGPVPTTVCFGSEERVLHEKRVLDVGVQCIIS